MSSLLPGQEQAIAEVDALRQRIQKADADTMSLIFTEAHTHNMWTDQPVSDALLKEAYDLAKMGPTAMNMQPMRVVFIRDNVKEQRLVPQMLDNNQAKTSAAPVTAILASDKAFYEKMDRIFPIFPDTGAMFANNPELAQENAERNGTLQAGYFMMALRAVGLDVAPMSGFNVAGVDQEFFKDSNLSVNFIVNIGYGNSAGVYPRLPRLDFEEVTQFLG